MKTKTDIVTLVSAISIFSACVNERTEVDKVTKDVEYPAESTFESKILYTENADLKVMAYAPEMHRYTGEKEYAEMPKGVEVVFYDSLKKESSKLTARYAIDRQSVFLMEARNDVVITNSLGEKLNTEHLIWDRKAQRIYSDVFVKITTADEIGRAHV